MSNTELNILPASSFSSEVWRGTPTALPIIIGFLSLAFCSGGSRHRREFMLMIGLNFGAGQNGGNRIVDLFRCMCGPLYSSACWSTAATCGWAPRLRRTVHICRRTGFFHVGGKLGDKHGRRSKLP